MTKTTIAKCRVIIFFMISILDEIEGVDKIKSPRGDISGMNFRLEAGVIM